MFNAPSDSRINNALSLLTGHQRWIERNTGLTNDPHQDHYIQNPDGVLANNRHFIADTQMEYQPNGDGTTEGQAIHILGYLHAYLATDDPMYLDKAIWHWDAYVNYFYRGLSLYAIYRKHGTGYNMFSRAALSDANDASLGTISVVIP